MIKKRWILFVIDNPQFIKLSLNGFIDVQLTVFWASSFMGSFFAF